MVFKNQARGEAKSQKRWVFLVKSEKRCYGLMAQNNIKAEAEAMLVSYVMTANLGLACRFINDTIRNDFHQRFLKKYVR